MLTRKMRSHYLKKNMSVNKIRLRNLYFLTVQQDNIMLGFSYKKLYRQYTGYCVRVRRSSDNVEQDFGFIQNYIDYTAILDFVGAGNSGYVAIWYNQYVLGNNAVQATTGNQPLIVNAGVFETNGLYFLTANSQFMSVVDYAAIDILTPPFSLYTESMLTSPVSAYVFTKHVDGTSIQYGNVYLGSTLALRIGTVTGTTLFQHVISINTKHKALYLWASKDANGVEGNMNNVILQGTKNADLVNYANVTIGCRVGTAYMTGHIKTVIVANTLLTYSDVSKI